MLHSVKKRTLRRKGGRELVLKGTGKKNPEQRRGLLRLIL